MKDQSQEPVHHEHTLYHWATSCSWQGNVLFNDTLNTFYLRLYGVRQRTIQIVREETRCHHMDYSFRLTARVLSYAPSHRQDNTYHGLCCTSHGALAGTRNSSMGPLHEGSIQRPIAPWANCSWQCCNGTKLRTVLLMKNILKKIHCFLVLTLLCPRTHALVGPCQTPVIWWSLAEAETVVLCHRGQLVSQQMCSLFASPVKITLNGKMMISFIPLKI